MILETLIGTTVGNLIAEFFRGDADYDREELEAALEANMREAYEAGYKEGFDDGREEANVREAYEAGFDDGYETGRIKGPPVIAVIVLGAIVGAGVGWWLFGGRGALWTGASLAVWAGVTAFLLATLTNFSPEDDEENPA